jgi:hypothetical protein
MHTSPRFSRPLRVLSLTLNIFIMLFLEALTYDIADPDDGSCETYDNSAQCLDEKSSLSNDASKCYWQSSDDTCHFRDIKGEFYRVVIVAVIAAIIGTPFAFAIEAIITNVLAAETVSRGSVKLQKFKKRAALDPRLIRVVKTVNDDGRSETQIEVMRKTMLMLQRAEEALGCSIDEEFNIMEGEVAAYRLTLTGDDRKEFDSK